VNPTDCVDALNWAGLLIAIAMVFVALAICGEKIK
jgi:hypothetical protein